MSTSNGECTSPRIFAPTSLVFDDSQLCFNKNHFGRPDFNVQRFMNLARRRAGLKQIQQDLRLYLKSVQHSMIELINDDYADFVHLSSNLVSLQSAIDKIDNDINTIWTEFENSTNTAVRTAERVESFCLELSENRSSQIEIRHRISFLSALQRLANLINNIPNSVSTLWLEKVSSCLVDISSYKEKLIEQSRESKILNKARNMNAKCDRSRTRVYQADDPLNPTYQSRQRFEVAGLSIEEETPRGSILHSINIRRGVLGCVVL
ncbi:Conserved oligomeric Golgi complex subunit 2 [Parelaphostrongylus tenuis]|uniref:Conserved oligomeric Golgi complex subunit 2 n=1 Tax=Parelaphostrongylus tenuis TaxID=148309 RepID=A0AAD5M4B5_PARTN|nr:Conserved oligomeric Golgi complex subunit 2 [Parelaphostrongylus tenuis]